MSYVWNGQGGMNLMRSGVNKLFFIGLLCAGSASLHAEIYKWRDAHGVMNYSDTPPPAATLPAQKTKPVVVPTDFPLTRAESFKAGDTNPANAAKPSDSKPMRESVDVANEPPLAVEALKAMQERTKAQNCASARSNYRNYAIGGRMQNVNEQGEKEFLSDQQIQEGLTRAQQEIEENCPPE